MTIFITGGCKNGKSTFALRQALALSGDCPRYYVATLIPGDAEQLRCVKNHREARAGLGFTTVECPQNLPACPQPACPQGTFLLDSVTALLMNEMYDADGRADGNAAERTGGDLLRFLRTVRNAVIVSDYIYADGTEYDQYSDSFVRGLAYLDRLLASECDCVVEVCGGIPTVHKGNLPERKEKSQCT